MNEHEALIALNLIDHVGPIRLRQLRAELGSAVAILSARRRTLQAVPGIGAETAEAIGHWEKNADLTGELRRIAEHGCRILIEADPEYPDLLRQIYDPPSVLYVRGRLIPTDRSAIALVGSRHTTHYGVEVARKLAFQLGYAGITVVSGGARGIDTAAHLGALASNGRTIVVLGTGLNFVFPQENEALFERIAEKGVVLTQFPFNRPADKQTFPIRNRIVAGLTLGTVVVEATPTSGSLITANFALEYGRQVFAVPGRIDSPKSRGCHELIKNGAKLCEGIDDILGEFEYLFGPRERDALAQQQGSLALSDVERQIWSALSTDPQSIDDILNTTQLPASTVNACLIGMEMKRLVRQLPGHIFVKGCT
ncbi:MAG: DNA-protecting protein DprA [Pedosphaera sp.]|nr:DNA-protecting protein DprA [Pedosphaera sp.]